jgi:hypothetical protein
MEGKLILQEKRVSMVQLAALPKGIYFARYKDSGSAGTIRFFKN